MMNEKVFLFLASLSSSNWDEMWGEIHKAADAIAPSIPTGDTLERLSVKIVQRREKLSHQHNGQFRIDSELSSLIFEMDELLLSIPVWVECCGESVIGYETWAAMRVGQLQWALAERLAKRANSYPHLNCLTD